MVPRWVPKTNLLMGGMLLDMGINKFLDYPERGVSWWLLLGMGIFVGVIGWFGRPSPQSDPEAR